MNRPETNRGVWTGVLAGVLAASVLLGVGLGAYRAGQRDEVVTRVIGSGDGEVVRVVDDGRWGHGPGPGFFLLPLLGIGLVVLLVSRGRGGGYGGGWCGPGPGAGWGPGSRVEDWHRRAHEEPRRTESSASPPASTPPTG